jgi:hypothetical protein
MWLDGSYAYPNSRAHRNPDHFAYSGAIARPRTHTYAEARRLRDDYVWCGWHGAGWKRHVSWSEARRVDGLGF